MQDNILLVGASIAAAVTIMILHEFPKAVVYYIRQSKHRKSLKHIFKLYHYVDCVGVLFYVAFGAGFSKPYMYGTRDKKTNIALGITGFFVLMVSTVLSYGLFIFFFGSMNEKILLDNMGLRFLYTYLYFMMLYPISMFMVNLFPISTFDIALIIAGKHPTKYFNLIQWDFSFKFMLLLFIVFQIPRIAGDFLIKIFLSLR